jgi:molybdopterin/thiamine biosynthesis adenylyltransferase
MKTPPKKLAVIGSGGTGSFLLPLLTRMTKDEITVFDGDVFTEENLLRQLFPPTAVGRNKALAMADLYPGVQANPTWLKDKEQLQPFATAFACPDNHLARKCVLEACDEYDISAIICGNEYHSASAFVYTPRWKDSPLDPRKRYPEIISDKSGSPVHHSCTGEIQEENPQLALANNSSALFAVQLWYCWTQVLTPEILKDPEARESCPIEMHWAPAKSYTYTIKDILTLYPTKEKKDEKRNDDKK